MRNGSRCCFTDEAGVGGYVVDAVGRDLTQLFIHEVVDIDTPWIAFQAQVRAAVLEVADHFLLLDVDRDHRLLLCLCGNDFGIDLFELRIAIRVLRAFVGLAIVLP